MCGSGTLLIEAALMASKAAPGLFRQSWPFQVSSRVEVLGFRARELPRSASTGV